jgi:hypothetical protein
VDAPDIEQAITAFDSAAQGLKTAVDEMAARESFRFWSEE